MTEVDKDTRRRLYNIWHTAVRRCHDTVHVRRDYNHYGGRGITVCPEWRGTMEKNKWCGEGYLVFEQWALTHGYKDGLTLDRVNNNAGYSPGNCRWISKKAQAYNRSSNAMLTYNGRTMTRVEWAD